MENIIEQSYTVSRQDRNSLNQHRSVVIWFTGLSGSGKSTIANRLEKALFDKRLRTYSLDGDNIRGGLNKGLSFSKEGRHENLRRIAEVGKLFVDAGIVTIAAFISPLRKDRALVREIIGNDDFLEVYVNTSLEACEERDVKGLYKKARSGEIREFTGIDAPYEAPVDPDIEIKSEKQSIEEAVEQILAAIEDKLRL